MTALALESLALSPIRQGSMICSHPCSVFLTTMHVSDGRLHLGSIRIWTVIDTVNSCYNDKVSQIVPFDYMW